MKKTWMVEVTSSIYDGSQWYGPYTRETAENLREKLSKLFGECGTSAYATPLCCLPVKEVLAQYKKEMLEE